MLQPLERFTTLLVTEILSAALTIHIGFRTIIGGPLRLIMMISGSEVHFVSENAKFECSAQFMILPILKI